jgi:hypothetical protein
MAVESREMQDAVAGLQQLAAVVEGAGVEGVGSLGRESR